MTKTVWLTSGTGTFVVPIGSPLEKRLRSQGYTECDPPIPGAPGEPDGSETANGADVAALNARIAELEAQVASTGTQALGSATPAPVETPASDPVPAPVEPKAKGK